MCILRTDAANAVLLISSKHRACLSFLAGQKRLRHLCKRDGTSRSGNVLQMEAPLGRPSKPTTYGADCCGERR